MPVARYVPSAYGIRRPGVFCLSPRVGDRHYCRACGRFKAHEQFSGRGHTHHVRHVCKECWRAQRQSHRELRNQDDSQTGVQTLEVLPHDEVELLGLEELTDIYGDDLLLVELLDLDVWISMYRTGLPTQM